MPGCRSTRFAGRSKPRRTPCLSRVGYCRPRPGRVGDMPLKRTRSEFTGIFNQDIFEAHADDIEALRKMQRGEDRFWDFETLLQDIETEASQIWFKHCGLTPSSWSVLSPDEAESVTQDAGWVIHYIRRLRERVEVGDAKKAAVSAIHLGLAFGRMRVRPHEPNALSGYKAAIGARHGHE